MKPRTKIRTLESAPPQYQNKKGWAMVNNGNYWTIAFEGGGETSLHISEFEAVEPAPAEASAPATANLEGCHVTTMENDRPATEQELKTAMAEWQTANPDLVLVWVLWCPVALPRSMFEPAQTVADLHARQAADFQRLLEMERGRPDTEGGATD